MKAITITIVGMVAELFNAAVNVITVVAMVYGVLLCLKVFGLLS